MVSRPPTTTRTTRVRMPRAEREQELRRRIEHVTAELIEARTRIRRAHEAARAAEEALSARRLELEAAALRAAELAELLESLQRQR
jgi:hypothetical protein